MTTSRDYEAKSYAGCFSQCFYSSCCLWKGSKACHLKDHEPLSESVADSLKCSTQCQNFSFWCWYPPARALCMWLKPRVSQISLFHFSHDFQGVAKKKKKTQNPLFSIPEMQFLVHLHYKFKKKKLITTLPGSLSLSPHSCILSTFYIKQFLIKCFFILK